MDERVIRYILQKHSIRVPKPSTAVVSKWASTILDEEYKDKLLSAQQRGQPLWWEQVQPPKFPLRTPKPLSELFPEDDDSTAEDSPLNGSAALEAASPSAESSISVPASEMSPDAVPEAAEPDTPADVGSEGTEPPRVK